RRALGKGRTLGGQRAWPPPPPPVGWSPSPANAVEDPVQPPPMLRGDPPPLAGEGDQRSWWRGRQRAQTCRRLPSPGYGAVGRCSPLQPLQLLGRQLDVEGIQAVVELVE